MQELKSKKKQQKALLSTELPDLFLMFPPSLSPSTPHTHSWKVSFMPSYVIFGNSTAKRNKSETGDAGTATKENDSSSQGIFQFSLTAAKVRWD